jgi:ParB/RepB/Spo0J family partition protein
MTTHAAAAAETAAPERFAQIPIDALVSSKTNPRRHFDGTYLADLARSIAEKGVIEPIVVRPLIRHGLPADGTFEVVAGECRLKAAKLANLTTLPAVIRPYTDEQALEVQLIENLHRTDLTPLEQATGYRALIDSNPDKHNVLTIAARVGMSAAWVWDRLKLNDLVPEAKQLLEDERIGVGHAILIARLKPEDQTRAIAPGARNGYGSHYEGLWQFDAGLEFDETERQEKAGNPYARLKPVSIRELEHWITRHIRFDAEHAAQAQPLDFGAVAERVELAQLQPGRGKKVVSITREYRVADDARDPNERTYGEHSWKRADGEEKSKTCDHSVLGVVAAGPGYGEAFPVCVNRDKCEVHWGKEIKAREKNRTLRESGQGKKADRREAAEQKRYQHEEQERARKQARWKVFYPALNKAVHAAAAKLPAALPQHVYQKVLKHHMLPRSTTPAQLQKALLEDAIKSTFERGSSWYGQEPEFVAWANVLGVDVKTCEPKPEVPSPKSEASPAKKNGKKARAA